MTKEIAQAWQAYAEKFNVLAEKMEEAGVSLELLHDVVKATEKLEEARSMVS